MTSLLGATNATEVAGPPPDTFTVYALDDVGSATVDASVYVSENVPFA